MGVGVERARPGPSPKEGGAGQVPRPRPQASPTRQAHQPGRRAGLGGPSVAVPPPRP